MHHEIAYRDFDDQFCIQDKLHFMHHDQEATQDNNQRRHHDDACYDLDHHHHHRMDHKDQIRSMLYSGGDSRRNHNLHDLGDCRDIHHDHMLSCHYSMAPKANPSSDHTCSCLPSCSDQDGDGDCNSAS